MITPVNALEAWLEADPNWAGYAFALSRGIWRDSATNASKRLACLTQAPGARSSRADETYNMVSLLLIGPQKGRADAPALEQVAIDLQQRLFTDYKTCDIAQIRLVGGIVGPSYTAEDRPWYELNLEILT